MNTIKFLSIILISSFVIASCTGGKSTTNQRPANAVGVVGGDYVTFNELKDQYVSGSLNQGFTLDDLQEFLPVYLDYRGKILAAKDAGYFENAEIMAEFELYSKQAAYAAWIDREIRPTKFNEFKNRYGEERKSKHVLVAVSQTAAPDDTLAAYNKAIEARKKFLAEGGNFMAVADEFSSRQNGRSMGGEIPWVSVGSLVSEYEDALYSLEIGEVSMPVRSQFGYHIILLEGKRKRVPARNVSHIFVPRQMGSALIDSAYLALDRGGQWSDAVREYSQDRPSIPNDGNIGWIAYSSRYDTTFVNAVMALNPAEPYSLPTSTIYGYHIFRLDSIRSFKNEEAEDEYLMNLLKNSNAYQENNTYVLNYIRQKFGTQSFEQNTNLFNTTVLAMDTTAFADIILPDSIYALPAFSFNGKTYNLGDFLRYLKETRGNAINKRYARNWVRLFEDSILDAQLTSITIERFPEFAEQVMSYKNGLVVYQINEDSVWSASTLDSSFVESLYRHNINEYQFPERHHYYLISSRADSNLAKARTFIEAGNPVDSLISMGIAVGVNSDSTGAFQGEPFTRLSTMQDGEISDIFEYSSRKAMFYLVKKLPPRTMTLTEAYNRVVSSYQPTREQNWLNRIRVTYNIQPFPEQLKTAYYSDAESP